MINLKKKLVEWASGLDIDRDYSDDFIVDPKGKKNLVICLGDSWTWGDSLPEESREQQIYGRLISNEFDADFINVGCRGFSNSWILLVGEQILHYLKKDISKYQKIYVIVTLTETARDIVTHYSFQFDYIDHYEKFGNTEEFYRVLLEKIELRWAEQIQNLLGLSDDRFVYFVGQNFVWHPKYDQLPDRVLITDQNWIEVLADYQKLPRPIRTTMVTGWIFDTFKKANDISGIKDHSIFKEFVLPYIEKANLVNQWLDSSNLNGKVASKHPNAVGHRLWAEHIINRLKTIS